MTGFPSGPWRVEHRDGSGCYNIVAGPDYFTREFVAFTGATIEGGEATANLIAAAPELYEACGDALELLNLDVITPAKLNAVGHKLEEVLAKARGGIGL